MQAFLSKAELTAAAQSGRRLEAGLRTPYAGEPVEYAPRQDAANHHPDAYPWHVVGRPDCDRVRGAQVVALDAVAP